MTYEKGRIYFNYFNTFYNVTREEAKRRAELYSALADGKTIQILNMEGNWIDVEVKKLNYIPETLKFRIKPKLQYRPFKTQEECWNEMLKHQPFGWIKRKEGYLNIVYVNDHYAGLSDKDGSAILLSSKNSYQDNSFADGTPFGIKEE